jgi:hypothetical protein
MKSYVITYLRPKYYQPEVTEVARCNDNSDKPLQEFAKELLQNGRPDGSFGWIMPGAILRVDEVG